MPNDKNIFAHDFPQSEDGVGVRQISALLNEVSLAARPSGALFPRAYYPLTISTALNTLWDDWLDSNGFFRPAVLDRG
jgi:hypothetical protein